VDGAPGPAPALSLTQMIMSGVFDRLLALKVFFAETRLGWVPFWMEEADYWYERHRHWAERLLNLQPLKQRPSDYVRQHIYFSVQHVERVAVELRHHLGVEHVMFATDFPTSSATGRTRGPSPSGSSLACRTTRPSRSPPATRWRTSACATRRWAGRCWRRAGASRPGP